MSSSDRRAALGVLGGLGLATILAGCGFQPIYGTGAPATRLIGRVAVDDIDGLMGFEMRKRLNERLGTAAAPLYALNVALTVDDEGLAISQNNEITRYNLSGEASYALRALKTGREVHRGTVRAFAAHSATASPFATRVARRDARARLATSLADQITSRLAVAATDLAP